MMIRYEKLEFIVVSEEAVSKETSIQIITLNRPEKANALNIRMCLELIQALIEADKNPKIGAILLQAEGENFCAGMDLNDVLDIDQRGLAEAHNRLFSIGSQITTPLIIAAKGKIFGGGVGLVANGHIVVAAEGSEFTISELSLGFWPYAIWNALALAIGEKKALELVLTCRTAHVQEAIDLGLVHYLVSHFELSEELFRFSLKIAKEVAVMDRIAIRNGLNFTREIRKAGPNQAKIIAAHYRVEAAKNPILIEAAKRFLKKDQKI